MQVLTKTLSSEDAAKILATEESHFVDLKSARIGPGNAQPVLAKNRGTAP